ncbi:MAG: TIGR03032 family protein, partial [Actinomycetota bacterium]|nr:TIGR03032 family protein [Actinomycetota bacterium]
DSADAGDLTDDRITKARAWLGTQVTEAADRQGARPLVPLRPLGGIPRDSLRISMLDAIFPDSTFVYVHRDPAQALPRMAAIWEAGTMVTHPGLGGWQGPEWSLPLVPDWQKLDPLEPGEIVSAQWLALTNRALDDLERLAPERWCVSDFDQLTSRPDDETQRLCRFLGLGWHAGISSAVAAGIRAADREFSPAALPPVGTSPPVEMAAARSVALIADTAPARNAGAPETGLAPLRSVYTQGVPEIFQRMAGSLLISTYQSGRLICARHENGRLNTHFRTFDRPMGIAVRDGWMAIGTRSEVHEYRNMPEVAPKLEPEGTHDACYLPRKRHFTGDIAVHDVDFAGDEIWLVATGLSCLATLDHTHSLVPRWAPPFITEIKGGDRCHLNGLALRDGRPRYVTMLGTSDEPGGWRPRKASGGVLFDIETNQPVVEHISMPHSPRWHRDELWVLESGKGGLCKVNRHGYLDTVAELPGFTRGLAFVGNLAFVGLSQIRETATFGGLPISDKADELECGVWIVDIDTGRTAGFIRFEEQVQEIFDVALMAGMRYPEIAEPGSTAALTSFQLPA